MQTHLLVFALSVGTTFGQVSDPVPPTVDTRTSAYGQPHPRHTRQPVPPPAGGLWVVEEPVDGPPVVHYYIDPYHKLCTDTLRRRRTNLKRRAVVARFNARLAGLLRTNPVALTGTR